MAFQLNNPYAAQENVADQFMKGQQIYSNNQKATMGNQDIKAEEIKRLVSIVTPDNYSSIRAEGIQKGLWSEEGAPMDYESAVPVIQQIRQQFGSSASATTPAAIQVAEYYRRQDEAGRKNFNEANRSASSQYLNTGAGFTNPYSANEFIPITPKAESMPGFKADVKAAEEQAVKDNDFLNKYSSSKAGAEYTINLIDNLIGNEEKGIPRPEGFEGAVGLSSIIPNRPGGAAKSFENRLRQIKGKQFLEAFESLKGGGAITQIEGQQATEAIARMQASNSEDEFLIAAKEFQDIVKNAMIRADDRYQKLTSGEQSNLNTPINTQPTAKKVIDKFKSKVTGEIKLIYDDGTEEIIAGN